MFLCETGSVLGIRIQKVADTDPIGITIHNTDLSIRIVGRNGNFTNHTGILYNTVYMLPHHVHSLHLTMSTESVAQLSSYTVFPVFRFMKLPQFLNAEISGIIGFVLHSLNFFSCW